MNDFFTKDDFEKKRSELEQRLRKSENAKRQAEAVIADTQKKLEALSLTWSLLHGSNGASPEVRKSTTNQTLKADQDLLLALPDEFTSTKFREVAGLERGVAFNRLKKLEAEEKIALKTRGEGKAPSIYLKVQK